METFQRFESSVQSYARSFPVVFERAQGSHLYDAAGNAYLDFLAGAGSLNYGHNHPALKSALIEYIQADGVTHGLDLHTSAKEQFLRALADHIFAPRGLQYRVQFTGPTGANAVEAALKIARKVTGRSSVVAFTNGFHGVTLGALAATGNQHHRGGAGVDLGGVERMPFDGYLGEHVDSLSYLEKTLDDNSSGIDTPAAVIVETVQGEGGLNVARIEWLQHLAHLCREREILLIVDDIQAGCGRTGTFFSFEPAGITPDIVTLSKSLSGFGLPLAVTLLKPELDQWAPGEHNGTFRGNNHAFVTATRAIEQFWSDDQFATAVRSKSEHLADRLRRILARHPGAGMRVKGRGMMQGIDCGSGAVADAVTTAAFEQGLVIETAGPEDEVVKCFCPLTISEAELNAGLDVLDNSFSKALPRSLTAVR